MLDLPYLVRLSDSDIVLTRPDELEPTFRALSRGLIARGVTHYERVAREAQFQRADRIVGRHFTHMIAQATASPRRIPPLPFLSGARAAAGGSPKPVTPSCAPTGR